MSWRRLILFGVFCYLLALIATTPAALVIEQLLPELLQDSELPLSNTSGTIWDGEGDLSHSGRYLGRLRWSFSPSMVLKVGVGADLELTSGTGTTRGSLMGGLGGTLTFSNITGSLPMDLLQTLQLIPAIPATLSGSLLLNLDTLEVADDLPTRAEGMVMWQQATVSFPKAIKLGDLRVVLTTKDNGVIEGKLEDGGGPLQASGIVLLKPDSNYSVLLNLDSRKGADKELSQALSLLGKPDGKGGTRLSIRGQL